MINIVEFLKSYKMVGQVHPTNIEDTTEPVIALLIPLNSAVAEYTDWSGQDITRHDFIKSLKDQGVHVFNNIEEFLKLRDNLKNIEKLLRKDKKKHKRVISEERKIQLKEHAKSMREKIRGSISPKD